MGDSFNFNTMQNFAKGLLDVADNLGRASSIAKESFSKLDASRDTTGAVQQLKTLLEGVEMTEKQLIEVLLFFVLRMTYKGITIFIFVAFSLSASFNVIC